MKYTLTIQSDSGQEIIDTVSVEKLKNSIKRYCYAEIDKASNYAKSHGICEQEERMAKLKELQKYFEI